MASDLAYVPYVDATHRGFVLDSFARCMLTTWPWSAIPFRALEERFLRQLRAPDSRALVAVLADEPETFCAWVVSKPLANEIVAGYTRRPLRRKWRVGTNLARAAGIDFDLPVGVWFWTYACERMVTHHAGYRLFHKVTDAETNPARSRAPATGSHPAGHHAQRT